MVPVSSLMHLFHELLTLPFHVAVAQKAPTEASMNPNAMDSTRALVPTKLPVCQAIITVFACVYKYISYSHGPQSNIPADDDTHRYVEIIP